MLMMMTNKRTGGGRGVGVMLPLQLLLLLLCIGELLAAAVIVCGTDGNSPGEESVVSGVSESSKQEPVTAKPNEVKQFLHTVQCTLEKAKPWIDDLEKEAKRLEETAKRVGLSIVHRFGSLVDTLIGAAGNRKPGLVIDDTITTSISSSSSSSTTQSSIIITAETEGNPNATVSPLTQSPLLNELSDNDADNEITHIETLN